MTIKINPRYHTSALYGKKPRPAIATEPFLTLLFIGIVLLFIPSLYLRSVVIVIWGPLIFAYERYLGLPAPAAPGTVLWLGSTLSYVVGGLGTNILDSYLGTNFLYTQGHGFGMRYLDSALLYLGLGLSAYAFGLWLTGQFFGPVPNQRNAVFGLKFDSTAIWFVGLLYTLPVLIKGFVPSSVAGVYDNVIIGGLQTIEAVPMILLGFYLVRPHPRWWVGLLFLGASLANPLAAMLIGYGRSKPIFAIIAVLLVWLALIWYTRQRVSRRAKVIIALLPLLFVIFYGVSTAYRNGIEFDSTLTAAERLQIAQESTSQFARSGNVIIDSVGPLVNRLVELPSIELLGWAENGLIEQVGWTLGDYKQVFFVWLPRVFFPEKGVGYRRDIMEYYGLSASWNNLPVTILTDAYRRFGVPGVLGLYFFMGIFSTIFALKLLPKWGALGLVLVIYFSLLHFEIYSADVLEVIKLYVYRLPSSGLVIFIFLRLTQIWQP